MRDQTDSPLQGAEAMSIRIRPATPADAAAIAAIYNEGIRARMATFETAERTALDVTGWFETPQPFLVATHREGSRPQVIGWVRASPYSSRACYARIAEFSVYVAGGARGLRVGSALMAAFLPACVTAGLWKLVSRIFPENAASRALCARYGFREVGVYEKHAMLDGAWRDVVIVERLIVENLRS